MYDDLRERRSRTDKLVDLLTDVHDDLVTGYCVATAGRNGGFVIRPWRHVAEVDITADTITFHLDHHGSPRTVTVRAATVSGRVADTIREIWTEVDPGTGSIDALEAKLHAVPIGGPA